MAVNKHFLLSREIIESTLRLKVGLQLRGYPIVGTRLKTELDEAAG